MTTANDNALFSAPRGRRAWSDCPMPAEMNDKSRDVIHLTWIGLLPWPARAQAAANTTAAEGQEHPDRRVVGAVADTVN